MLIELARSRPGFSESTMSISSCSDKSIRVQTLPDPAKSPERAPRLPTFSRAELYSFPDPEEVADAPPTVRPPRKKAPPAKAAVL
ncbi:hypothetical protein D9M68_995210 [compost metagenome]